MLAFVLALSIAAHSAVAGEIYGDVRLGEKYLPAVKLSLTCGTEKVEGTTDAAGSFRITAKGSGKCKFAVAYEKDVVDVDVVVFDKPTKYRFVLERAEGKLVLKRV
jgi:hypothetical protein